MVITYPLMTVVDDSGAVVTGATVAVTSVKDKAGTDVATPGATVNQSGANVSVDYDAAAKGEAWVVLAVSKSGSTFTGLNAAPAFYLATDSSRILTALPAAAPAASGGLLTVGTGSGQINAASGKVPADVVSVGGSTASPSGTVNSNLVSVNGVTFTGANAPAAVASGGITTASFAAGAIDASAFAQAAADKAWATTTRILSAGTNIVLAKGVGLTGLNDIAATSVVSAGAITTLSGAVSTVTSLTNAPTSGDFTTAMKTSLNAATPAVTVSDKTGFSLTSAYDPAKTAVWSTDVSTGYTGTQAGALLFGNLDAKSSLIKAKTDGLPASFPANFSVMAIAATTGQVGVDLGNVKQATSATTLTNITVPAVTSVTNPVTVGTNDDKSGYSLTVAPPTAADIAAAVLTDTTDLATVGSLGHIVTTAPSWYSAPPAAVTLAASQPNYAPSKAGDAMTLTAAYDAAKSAAPAGTALSNAVWTDAKAAFLDASVGTRSTFDPTAAVTFRDQDSVGTPTWEDAMAAAWADAFGKWAFTVDTGVAHWTMYAPDAATAIRRFTLDSSTAPTQRA